MWRGSVRGSSAPGTSQSPVDLGSPVAGTEGELVINYRTSLVFAREADSTLEFKVASGSAIAYGRRRYGLNQFHFHTPSEHAIGGELAVAEIHFVHMDRDGNPAVVAVFVDENGESKGPRRLEQGMPMGLLLPESTTHYAYDGSLTTQPFSEGVKWMILTERVTMHPSWIEAFCERYGPNNRPVQPLNGRTITLG
ncbi:MAG: carbonic anhydrase [Actinobacteria bacterium]|nr:MAG: carbonic anhydrase [Actinomycetota bacterium]